MTRVGHLIDSTAGWEQRVGIHYLHDRLPTDRFHHVFASIDGSHSAAVRVDETAYEVVRPLFGASALAGPAIRGFVERHALDLIHTWGVRAAVASRSLTDLPVVLELFDPCVAAREIKPIRTLSQSGPIALICSCEIVRRRLIEGGVEADKSVVIRPGIDFGLVNRAQRSGIRDELGVPSEYRVFIVAEPVTRDGGQSEAFWAIALRNSISHNLRVIVPGSGDEVDRIRRLDATVPGDSALLLTGDRYPFEQLLTAADALLVTPRGDASTTAIAWAMAANVPVIGTAVYSVAELLSSQVNGLLFKQTLGRSMASAILKLLDDQDAQKKVAETARGQAFEVFGLRRFAEQHMQVYGNVLAGKPASEGVVDSAIDL